jgi:predicted alpha-1,2-mannosidase
MLKFRLMSILFLLSISIISYGSNQATDKDYTQYVNPFIGTAGNANTFPGPALPFAMVQLGPYISSNTILGFTHRHNSGGAGGGSGVRGDILFMPAVSNAQTIAKENCSSSFSSSSEEAFPGYYKVYLDDYKTLVELTATTRVGLHKYTFPNTDDAKVVLSIDDGEIFVKDGEISGYNSNNIFFVAKFSKQIKNHTLINNDETQVNGTEVKGNSIKGIFRFETNESESILLKVAISPVSIDGARKNLNAELPDWDFNVIMEKAKTAWNKVLSKIEVEGGSIEERTIFYTALYHATLQPNIYMDVDRKYRSTNGEVYVAMDFDNYTQFSLWDTFRAAHPLYTIIDRERTNEFISTFLERYDHNGRMLIMEFLGEEGDSPPMIGYHSLSVIADAYVKNIRSYDVSKAFSAMKHLANDKVRECKELYLDYGFIPADLKGQAVSRTLEYSYDDWCVTRLAKDFNEEDNLYFSKRSEFYKNVFDKDENFMRGRMSNFQWVPNFDPMETINHYTEANAYQYTTFVPQDIEGLTELMGGDKKFEDWLDACFNTDLDPSKVNVRDVSGLIGQYAHGNEPSHHIAYLYNFIGTPWKTQKMTRKIMSTLYSNTREGIDGNEDCGQLSAWYVLSAMGIYSVTPGMDYYVIGSPIFDKVTINMENGNRFEIIAKNNRKENPYIQSAALNGKPYSKSYINYFEFMNGSKLEFEMGDKPNYDWGAKKEDRPYSDGNKFSYASSPIISFPEISFLDSRTIKLASDEENANVRFTLDGNEVTESSTLYTIPITITEPTVLTTKSFVDGIYPSCTNRVRFNKLLSLEAVEVDNLEPGIKYSYKEADFPSAKSVKDYPTIKNRIMETFNVDSVKDDRQFGYNFEGFLNVPETGVYQFTLEANDGALLYLNDQIIIDNDGGHRAQKLFSKIVLKKGLHPIKVDYFQQGLAKSLFVIWEGSGLENQEISKNALFHIKE